MLRYFLALPLPDATRAELLWLLPPPTEGIRPTKPDEFHLTLHFLGARSAAELESLAEAVRRVNFTRFAFDLRGVGTFDADGRPAVLWAGVAPSAELHALHAALGAVLGEAIGYRPETRPYRPHVTLARLAAPLPNGYLERHRAFACDRIRSPEFTLFESDFRDGVPAYREVISFPLRGAE